MEPFKKLITELYVPDIQAEVLTYIYMVSYKMDANTEKITEQYGITRAQFNILNILNQHFPQSATVSLLKERTVVVKSDVSRIVMRLQKAGLIDTSINAKDRRSLNIKINEKGRGLFADIVKHKEELLKPFNSFTEIEIMQMKSYLRKLLTEIEK